MTTPSPVSPRVPPNRSGFKGRASWGLWVLESNSSWRAPDLEQLGRPGGCSPPPLLPRIPIPTAWESGQWAGRRRPFFFFCPRPLLPAGAGRSGRSSEEASPARTGHITRTVCVCVGGGSRLVTPLAPADFGRACSVGAEAPRSCQQLRGRRAGSFFLRRAGSFWALRPTEDGKRRHLLREAGASPAAVPGQVRSGERGGQLEMGAKAGSPGGGDSLAWRIPKGK